MFGSVSDMNFSFFSEAICAWFLKNGRDLPWRNTDNPYLIWISEIILQQTRVSQGRDYYCRFVERFPAVNHLAAASEGEVLKLWQGLGYYSRARNLHKAAISIVEQYNGIFPCDYAAIRKLKGVGDYTAAAIASFAFNMPYATVDGNVYRVLSRFFAIAEPIDSKEGKKMFATLAQSLLNNQNPCMHNQALMELGALVCLPAQPKCEECPLSFQCIAKKQNTQQNFPVKSPKKQTKIRYFNYLDICCGNERFLQKRTEKDIWRHLYELPLIETQIETDLSQLLTGDVFQTTFRALSIKDIKPVMQQKHVLTHRIIMASFYRVEVETAENLPANFLKIKKEDTALYPVSALVEKYFLKT